MPHGYEIEIALRAAIVIAANGSRMVTTVDFVRELRKVNWEFSLRDARNWIEASVCMFMLFNPNGGLMTWAFHHQLLIIFQGV